MGITYSYYTDTFGKGIKRPCIISRLDPYNCILASLVNNGSGPTKQVYGWLALYLLDIILACFHSYRQTDRQTDRQTECFIRHKKYEHDD